MRVKQHPIHLVTEENATSPSSFIPFCDFGGDMSSVGVKIDALDIPVCNSFQARILNDQLCYEIDLNRFSNKDNIEKELKVGFNFIMDYNEDRQLSVDKDLQTFLMNENKSFAVNIIESDDIQHASIHFDTIGKH